jgi:hypothetical protein
MLLSRAAGSNGEKDFDPTTGVLERQRKVRGTCREDTRHFKRKNAAFSEKERGTYRVRRGTFRERTQHF